MFKQLKDCLVGHGISTKVVNVNYDIVNQKEGLLTASMSLEGGGGLSLGLGFVSNEEEMRAGVMLDETSADVNVVDQDQYTIVELLGKECCETNFEEVEIVRNDYSHGQVCSDSESDGALEHLAKVKTVVLDSDVHQEMKI